MMGKGLLKVLFVFVRSFVRGGHFVVVFFEIFLSPLLFALLFHRVKKKQQQEVVEQKIFCHPKTKVLSSGITSVLF